MVLSVGVVFF